MGDITIVYPLHAKQKEWLADMARLNLLRAGRRTGKTYLSIRYLIKRSLEKPGLHWFVAQDLGSCTDNAMPLFEKYMPKELILKATPSRRTYKLINGSVVQFKSAEQRDSLRGRGVDTVICEEAAFWPGGKDIWGTVIRPQLADTMGHALIISSPNGSNWLRRLEQGIVALKAQGKAQEWFIGHGKITDNPHVPPDEIEAIKASCTEEQWQQEYMAEYVDSVGVVYWDYKATNTVTAPPSPIVMGVRGLDWGMDDDTAASWVYLLADGDIYIGREYSQNNLDAPTQARNIVQAGKNLIQPQWNVLDSACWARDPMGVSVADRFAQNGLPAEKGTKELDSSVSDVKSLISAGKIWINVDCRKTLKALQEWQYGAHEPDILAAMRYAIDLLVRTGKVIRPPSKEQATPIAHPNQQWRKDQADFQNKLSRIRVSR